MKKEIILRNSKQRKLILEELRKLKTHPTADNIFGIIRKRIPKISFGTVYRNLNLLRSQNQILELTCGRYSCRYDGNPENHYHFVCKICGKVYDLGVSLIKNLEKKISEKTKFKIESHKLEFYGICKNCERG